jgi:Kef-type K+ transport system membrane component KefB
VPKAVPFAEIFLAIAVIVVAARITGALFQRMHQPAVVGEIVAGLLLGATALGRLPGHPTEHLFPTDSRPFLKAIAALGLVLFMFIVGLELDLKVIRGQERLATSVSLASIALPFGGGILLGLALYTTHRPPDTTQSKIAFALFIGAAMSITAFPVLARILADRGMLRTPLGAAALASAAVDDVIAWSLLAVVVAIAGPSAGGGEPQWHIWLTLPYLVAMVVLVRPLLKRIVAKYNEVGRLTPDLLAVILVGLLLSSYATDWLGIHYIFGAFLFGAVMPREGAAAMFHQILERLEQVSVLLLLPVFFVVTGLAVDFWHMGSNWYWQLPAILGVAIAGKFIGAFTASRLQGVPRPRSAAIGVLMNTRGLTEIVILTVGQQKGILDAELFSMLVFMAVFTTLMTGPLLRVVYSDRRLARDVADAEKAALGAPQAYRVVVATPPDQTDPTPVRIARDLLGSERPAELVLAQIRPLATPTLEVGSGLTLELSEFAASAERLEALRREAAQSDLPAVTLVRMSQNPAAELATMANDVEANVVVIDDAATHHDVVEMVTCQVILVSTNAAGSSAQAYGEQPRVLLSMEAGRDADAAAEIALRLVAGSRGELVVREATSAARSDERRAASMVAAAQKAGLNASMDDGRSADVAVMANGTRPDGITPVHLHVTAEQDRDVLSPDRLAAGVLSKLPART